ncbi:hypothetical protein ACN27F_00770 [Solwaraspora sp. WMMB335]|uniref:hypothetical protein n=1 Tax=Solwaraspora sp. WMMB335 TaxID=3404118 RepID=UPI003B9429A6
MPARASIRALAAERGLELSALLTAVIGLVASAIAARTVDAGGRGALAVLVTWATVLAWTATGSVDKAVIARADVRSRPVVPPAVGLTVLGLLGVASVPLALGVGAVVVDGPWLVVMFAAVTCGNVAVDMRAADLVARRRWSGLVRMRLLQPLLYLGGCLAAAATTAIWPAYGISLFVAAVGVSVWLPPLLVGGWRRIRPVWPTRGQSRRLVGFAGGYHLGAVLHLVNLRIDLLLLPSAFALPQVGVYAVATAAGNIVGVLGSAGLLRGLTGRAPGNRVIDGTGLGLSSLLAAVVAGSAPWSVPLAFGSGFVAAVPAAQLLCLAGVLVAVRHGVNGRLAGQHRPWATAAVNGCALLVFLAVFPFCRTVTEVASATVLASAVSLALAGWLVTMKPHAAQEVIREVQPCESASTPQPSCPSAPPGSSPSPTGSSAGSPLAPTRSR